MEGRKTPDENKKFSKRPGAAARRFQIRTRHSGDKFDTLMVDKSEIERSSYFLGNAKGEVFWFKVLDESGDGEVKCSCMVNLYCGCFDEFLSVATVTFRAPENPQRQKSSFIVVL